MYSEDLYNWKNIPGPHLKPTIGDSIMRDPFIKQSPDGTFHLVWTTGWGRKDIGYSSSKDLVNWSLILVMEGSAAINCWVAKIFFDNKLEQWIIIWSTWLNDGTFGEPELPETSKQQRIFYTTAKDFENFDEAKLLFDTGYSCIDAFIFKDGSSSYLLFFKDERGNEADEKLNLNWQNIRMASSNNMYGPYGNITGPITVNGEGEWHNEGPCAVKFKDEYFLFYEHHSGDTDFGAVKSDDLKEWSDISNRMNFPDGTKHGSIIKINNRYLEKLLEVKY